MEEMPQHLESIQEKNMGWKYHKKQPVQGDTYHP